jgi:hypothetical protein
MANPSADSSRIIAEVFRAFVRLFKYIYLACLYVFTDDTPKAVWIMKFVGLTVEYDSFNRDLLSLRRLGKGRGRGDYRTTPEMKANA